MSAKEGQKSPIKECVDFIRTIKKDYRESDRPYLLDPEVMSNHNRTRMNRLTMEEQLPIFSAAGAGSNEFSKIRMSKANPVA